MITTKFFAADIENLTDARYFAAWGAEWMSFLVEGKDLHANGLARIKEIIDWIDGPKMALRFPEALSIEQIMEISSYLNLDGIIIEEKKAALVSKFGQEIVLIIPKQSIQEIEDCAFDHILLMIPQEAEVLEISEELKEEYKIYVQTNWSAAFISKNQEVIKQIGLVLKGGEEEKVGYKSYDDLDEIFEVLEEI